MFKFDTHVHTSETSPCGHVSAEDTVKLYAEAGYSGFCITDHYTRRVFESWGCSTWENTLSRYLQGYRNAYEYGKSIGFDVLLGAEICLDGSPNDYLLFGITEEFLFKNPQLYKYKINELKEILKKNNILIFQAHPFRPYLTRENPIFLDGVEVVNGNIRHNSRNELALEFAEQNNLLVSGGSDCHEIEDVGKSGIITKNRIKQSKDLIKTLQSKCFDVIPL